MTRHHYPFLPSLFLWGLINLLSSTSLWQLLCFSCMSFVNKIYLLISCFSQLSVMIPYFLNVIICPVLFFFSYLNLSFLYVDGQFNTLKLLSLFCSILVFINMNFPFIFLHIYTPCAFLSSWFSPGLNFSQLWHFRERALPVYGSKVSYLWETLSPRNDCSSAQEKAPSLPQTQLVSQVYAFVRKGWNVEGFYVRVVCDVKNKKHSDRF